MDLMNLIMDLVSYVLQAGRSHQEASSAQMSLSYMYYFHHLQMIVSQNCGITEVGKAL